MARPVTPLGILDEERAELERRVRASTTSPRDCRRARIILLRSQGLSQRQVAEQVGVSVACVGRWSRRFDTDGIVGLHDRPGRGRRPSIPSETVEKVVAQAEQKPPGKARWTTRSMARHAGVSQSTVSRVWRRNGLQPHRTRTSRLSKDKQFERKFWDVAGLCMDPPDKVVVLCCDEKTESEVSELTRTDPTAEIGHSRTPTHNDYRHGAICLFAAISYLDGKLTGRVEPERAHVEHLRFLKQVHREVPRDLDVHLIADNGGSHEHAQVKAWLKRHRRFHVQFTPTSSSWMNLVERFFADLTEDCIRADSFASVEVLTDAITAYLAEYSGEPKPYRWKADREMILDRVHRSRKPPYGPDE